MTDDTGDTKPLDFDDSSLDWGDEPSNASDPPPETDTLSADTDADPTPEGATTPPEPSGDESGDRQPQGPIPFDRHEAILAKEREKRTALETKWQRVAWAEELQQAGKTSEQVQQALQMFDGINQDPVGFLERFHTRLQEHPDLAQPLRSWAGRVLASRNGVPGATAPQGADPNAEPQPDFQNEAGVPFYSGPQLQKWQAWQARQQEAKFQTALAPLMQERVARQQQEAARTIWQQQAEKTKAELTELRKIPAFRDNEAKVKAYLEQHEYKVPLVHAFNHVLVTEILPALGHSERTAQLAELQQKAAASSVNPGNAASTTPRRPKDFDDPSLEW